MDLVNVGFTKPEVRERNKRGGDSYARQFDGGLLLPVAATSNRTEACPRVVPNPTDTTAAAAAVILLSPQPLQSLFGRMMGSQEDLEAAAAAYMEKYLVDNSIYSTLQVCVCV
jgi:hypothetical protein